MDNLSITTKLTFEDFRKANFYFLYRKRTAKISLVLGTILLLVIITPYVTGTSFCTQFPAVPLAIALMLTVLPPFSILRTARKNYDSNKMINEQITYDFDKELVSVTGESFHSKLSWDKLYEVKVTTSWFLIWQNRQVANVIPRRDITDKQIELIKELLKDNGQVKKSFG